MGLIVEPDDRCHLRDGLPIEEAAWRGLDPPRHDVLVWGDPERTSEASHEMRTG